MLTAILLILCSIVSAVTFGIIAYVEGHAQGFNECYRQFMRQQQAEQQERINNTKKTMSNITDRIKTFQDACRELGEEHPMVQAYNNMSRHCGATETDILAYLKLRIITAALNEGWEPQFAIDESRYYPWFCLYTKDEYDNLNEDDKKHCVLRSGGNTYSNYGFVNVNANYASSGSDSYSSARLAFRTREIARYAVKQFLYIYADFVFKADERLSTKP